MTLAHQQLRSFVDRVLRLKGEQDKLGEDIKQVYAEAHAMRFNKTAMGQVVAYLRKRKKGAAKLEEGEATFATYLHEYDHGMILATHAHEADRAAVPPRAPIDRTTRSKRRTSESMDDNKALSAEALALGLISEEAHAETVRISDGIARKFGAGVIDPETGEILDDVPAAWPATGQVEPFAPVPGEEACRSLASSPINPEAKATEVEPGNAGGNASVRQNNDRAGVASRPTGGWLPEGESGSCALGASLSPSNPEASFLQKWERVIRSEGVTASPEECGASGQSPAPDDGGDNEAEVASSNAGLESSCPQTSRPTDAQALRGQRVASGGSRPIPSEPNANASVDVTAGRDRQPIPQSGAISPAPDAPVECPSSHDRTPGDPVPCEANDWAGLEIPPQFDRRHISETAA